MINNFLDALPAEVLENSKQLELKIRSVNAHNAIDSILERSVLRGGKRLRPLLTYLVAHLFRVDFKTVAPFARATELVHAASLSHDDVIDNATTRRDAPSINILASNKKAVLAGDYLLSSVIVDLAYAGNLELVKEMSLVIKDLSEGEWLQLDLIDERKYTREIIREVAKKKTSSVMSYCVFAPAVLSGQSDSIKTLCKKLGESLGLAFQLIDDTLDYSQDSQKDSELDLKNGIVNAVVYEFLNDHPQIFLKFKNGENLYDLLKGHDLSKAIEAINTEAHEHLNICKNILDQITLLLLDSDSFYKDNEVILRERIGALELILTYMALRKN